MMKEEHPMEALKQFLPEGSFELVVQYIHHYKVHLTITKARKSVLGDYRHAFKNQNHRITVNGNLNTFEFLITLLHELAHLLTYDAYGNRVEAHGKEWKASYSKLLTDFVAHKIFPADIEQALQKSIINPSATANGEVQLLSVLRKYNRASKPGWLMIQELPLHAIFQTQDGRVFRKLEKRRTRYSCIEIATARKYLFSAVHEVFWIQPSAEQ